MAAGAKPTDMADLSAPADIADRVYAAVIAAISDGDVGPGRRLASERKLSTDLNAPRAAVRRALQRLTAEGMIERGVGRAGSRVSKPSPEAGVTEARDASPQDVLEARWAFEPGLVRLIVARATELDFQTMERQLDRMAGAESQQAFREAGYSFHLELTKATRNPLLVDMFEMIIAARARAGWGRLAALNATAEQREKQVDRNRLVLTALRNRDAPLAAELLLNHLAIMVGEVGRGP